MRSAGNTRPGSLQSDQFGIRSLIEAAGAALLVMLPSFFPLITPGHITLFHHNFNLANVFGGIAIDLVAVFLACVALLWLLSRLPAHLREITEACVAAFFIWLILEICITSLASNPEERGDSVQSQASVAFNDLVSLNLRYRFFLGISVFLFLGLMAWARRGSMRAVVRAVRLSLACFAFCAIWIVPEFLGLTFKFHRTQDFNLAATKSPSASQPRIVWILFDELSYKLVFSHAPDAMSYPGFQQLRSQSVSLDNIEPVGYFTDRVIPSLMRGRKIGRISSTADGQLLYLDTATSRWETYDPESTLFGLANRKGWNPAIAGWFNPYCRIFPRILTACSWSPVSGDQIFQESKSDNSLVASTLAMPRQYVNHLFFRSTSAVEVRNTRIANYHRVMANASTLIEDSQLRFVFLHLPVPHPPGFYDRSSHQLSASGNYLDNLALADDTLQQLMQEIAQTPWAAETTVIVSSDHSWRLPLWDHASDWTAEEQGASQNTFDPRPVFLVHFPGQTIGAEISAIEPELAEHDIIAAMLEGNIQNSAELRAFLASTAR